MDWAGTEQELCPLLGLSGDKVFVGFEKVSAQVHKQDDLCPGRVGGRQSSRMSCDQVNSLFDDSEFVTEEHFKSE